VRRGGGGGGGPGAGVFGWGTDEQVSRKDASRLFRRLWPFLRPYKRQVAVATVLLILQTVSTLAGPFLVRFAIDSGIRGHHGGKLNLAAGL